MPDYQSIRQSVFVSHHSNSTAISSTVLVAACKPFESSSKDHTIHIRLVKQRAAPTSGPRLADARAHSRSYIWCAQSEVTLGAMCTEQCAIAYVPMCSGLRVYADLFVRGTRASAFQSSSSCKPASLFAAISETGLELLYTLRVTSESSLWQTRVQADEVMIFLLTVTRSKIINLKLNPLKFLELSGDVVLTTLKFLLIDAFHEHFCLEAVNFLVVFTNLS